MVDVDIKAETRTELKKRVDSVSSLTMILVASLMLTLIVIGFLLIKIKSLDLIWPDMEKKDLKPNIRGYRCISVYIRRNKRRNIIKRIRRGHV